MLGALLYEHRYPGVNYLRSCLAVYQLAGISMAKHQVGEAKEDDSEVSRDNYMFYRE